MQTGIPIRLIPESYDSPASRPGRVEVFRYEAGGMTKTAYVCLPHGYGENPEKRYNVLYFMHGGGDRADYYYNRDYALNDILDHAAENGEIEPMIVVTPSFYPPDDRDSSVRNAAELVKKFPEEFIHDLMPAVEGHYRTYAENADAAGLEASRGHRAFGGFSMGSVTTWYQFLYALDYVKFFMPLSGDCWRFGELGGLRYPDETARFLNDYVSAHRYAKDFRIHAMTGSEDIAYPAMKNQLGAMRRTDAFLFRDPGTEGNISFDVMPGGVHDYKDYRNYIYTILPYLFR